ncbi:glutamate 5-kinase [Planomicrobium sp. Y74]|uniref:glutamate 5-kinase n=1 Tax=Planomicrobium sp. Y74 TaxID=2478977 RepID=UPI000EF47323|nr:glutamate 5-kinase [Planomicrobium sp. Y74]RLQ89732.1 glutamate 5-kinase [Planomicrobium sp. Y74]
MEKKRIVVKIGSSSLTHQKNGLCIDKLQDHVDALAYLKKLGHEVVLVSSGAVAAGCTGLGYLSRPVHRIGRQSAAAVGQSLLLQAYVEEFKKHGILAAQLLLTKDHYVNARETIIELLEHEVLPVINENDSVSAEDLSFGDNDMLSALVSGLIKADFLMILTDVNGVYGQNPNKNPAAKKYDFLTEISEELMNAVSGSDSEVGTGGMKSKVKAAGTALSFGADVFIGSGNGQEKLFKVLIGKGDGTYISKALEAIKAH